MNTLIVANRGEIAVRVLRTARERGLRSVAVYAADDRSSAHVGHADEAIQLTGTGPSAYLDIGDIMRVAAETGSTLLHPGYGFLSENAELARACASAEVTFVGPSAGVLEIFGDKAAARAVAIEAGVPVLAGTPGRCSVREAETLLRRYPDGIMLKAVHGGGGRGMAAVRDIKELAAAFDRCAREAAAASGQPELLAEELFERAKHIEVQVVAATDTGRARRQVLALGDRDCSVQRRNQKVLECGPAPGLTEELRRDLHAAACRVIGATDYCGVGTVEFLVRGSRFVFLEVNPRIQVEHTITEEILGLDLVACQIEIARGLALSDLDLPSGVVYEGHEVTGDPVCQAIVAMQARINAEAFVDSGDSYPSSGVLETFRMPEPDLARVDTHAFEGMKVSGMYDSLLAKVIVRSDSGFEQCCDRMVAALDEVTISPVENNTEILEAIVQDPEFRTGTATTDYFETHWGALAVAAGVARRDSGSEEDSGRDAPDEAGAVVVLRSPMPGTVVEVATEAGSVDKGGSLVVLEAMKMYHVLRAPAAVAVLVAHVGVGEAVTRDDPLLEYRITGEDELVHESSSSEQAHIRDNLVEVQRRHALTLDAARPEAIERVHARGRRTARENLADLIDPGSLVEYGALALAAQLGRRSEEELIARTPADGMICGTATVNASLHGATRAKVVVMAYDYSVLAGTQGMRNHLKNDRMFDLARRMNLPVILFPEGGGGRPGDVDSPNVTGLQVPSFVEMGALSGVCPVISVVSGRCFAGNAAMLGMSDIVIATPDANIGMGGPAMIEGGGLGTFNPEEIGPISVQRANGVVDIVADSEAEAVALARTCLGFFQGEIPTWEAPPADAPRSAVPTNRLHAYDARAAIDSIVDVDSAVELRADYGRGIITTLARVEGRPFGLFINDTRHLGGAIDAEAADKLYDFMTMCESHGIAMVSLCDTPGFMVGPQAEKDATVRRFSRLFVAGARLSVPFGLVVLRKAYGLGAMAMAGGSVRVPQFAVSWPSGELGPMGLEGSVRLGFRRELEAAPDEAARDALFNRLVSEAYEQAKAMRAAGAFEIDDVIDPADTRRWISSLSSASLAGS
jgi:acetyl/propionyl-CoA carboxylase alpha subunit